MRLLLFLLLFSLPLFAEDDNPFATDNDASIETVVDSTEVVSIDSTATKEKELPFWYGYISFQKDVNKKLSDEMSALKKDFSLPKIAILLLVSLFYSILHTAGPGHGKAVLGSYFLSSNKKHTKLDAAKAGIIVSVTHIGTAFILSFFLFIVIKSFTQGAQQDNIGAMARGVGGVMIILTGIFLLFTSNPKFHEKLELLEHKLPKRFTKNGSLVWFSVLSGIVPCPLAWFVLIFSISYDMYIYGILSVIAMAIGAAITVGSTGALVLHSKEKAFSFLSPGKAKVAAVVMRVCSGCILITLGSMMSIPV